MRYIPYPSGQTPMYNGTSYQSGTVPTIGNIGSAGYNNQYYDPYYIRQQQEAQKQLIQQQQQTQITTWRRLIKCRDNLYGYTNTPEEIEECLNNHIKIHQQMECNERFANDIHLIAQQGIENQKQEQIIADNIERARQITEINGYPQPIENKSLYQWLHEDAQERFMQSQYDELRHQRRDISNVYDSNGYKQLLGVHDSVFNSLNQEVTIDDMEIQVSLPERLRRERDIRRQLFAESLKTNR